MCQFAVYLFTFEHLKTVTITNYFAGMQNQLVTIDAPQTVWSPALHQTMKGMKRDESNYSPIAKRMKLPFVRQMILHANNLYFKKFRLTAPVHGAALHAAMCLGLMFLFRKSEYLTNKNGLRKNVNGHPVTLIANDVQLWYGNKFYPASAGHKLPKLPPDMISMFLGYSKADQFGKGANRFFPAEPNNKDCMCKVVHHYCRIADLQPQQPIFAGPHTIITGEMISAYMKKTAIDLGVDHKKVSHHSLRIAGLVTLFAADVPDSLKQLAGRWADPKSFVIYARATMQQFTNIATALNNPQLVTVQHIKQFYQQHGQP
jgi:hypothetical protein